MNQVLRPGHPHVSGTLRSLLTGETVGTVIDQAPNDRPYYDGMARITGSWLSGPSSALPDDGQTHAGATFGFPADGPGSVAGFGKRTLALVIDWLMAMGLAAYLPTGAGSGWATVTFLVWFVIGVVAVTLFTFTPGQLVAGLRVARIEGDLRVGFVRALVRQIFLSFVVPAVITDRDGRGMHDRATGTVLIRQR